MSNNNSPEPEKNLGTFTTNLIRFFPLGGSSFAFVSLLIKQEWVIALILFPVNIITVIWAAYSKSVLNRFAEIYTERGTKDADTLIASIDKADKSIKESIKWQLAKPEEKYLTCQGNACTFYTTEGTANIFKPLLKDVFVPLELSGDFLACNNAGELTPNPRGYQWEKQLVNLMEQKEGLQIWDIFKQLPKNKSYRTLAILAWGGYGKTTLLRHITYNYAQGKLRRGVPKLLPVLILLRRWQTVIFEQKPDLVTLIEKYHIPSLPEGEKLKRPPNWMKNLLCQNKILVMFDGFDEVKEDWQPFISKWIATTMDNHPNAYFILTSRPAGYKNYKVENKPNTTLRLKAFNEAQRERFINQWYLARERHVSVQPDNPEVKQTAKQKSANLVKQLKDREELNDLAKNPLLLNQYLRQNEEGKLNLKARELLSETRLITKIIRFFKSSCLIF